MTEPFRWGACSEVGLVRQINEDSKCHQPPLFAVADGMGGHSAGDVASALAIEELISELTKTDSLSGAVRAANRAIFLKAAANPKLAGMGTTITALLATKDSAQIAHVGDSRAYLLREGELSRLTQDHTVVNRLVQQGRLAKEDADRHPQRSYLERALGIDSDVEVDVHVLDLSPGDRVLLCSDGLFGMIDDDLIDQVLTAERDPQRAAERLCEEAIHAGGNDNVTTIVIDLASDSSGSEAPALRRRSSTATSTSLGAMADTGPLYDPEDQGALRAGSRADALDLAQSEDRADSAPIRSKRATILGITTLLLVLGGAFVATQMWLDNSWFVGSKDGRVTIFKGAREEVAGINLSEVEMQTDLATDSLPDIYQVRLEQGIPASSRSDALRVVEDLQAKVAPSPSASPDPAADSTPASSPPAA